MFRKVNEAPHQILAAYLLEHLLLENKLKSLYSVRDSQPMKA